jgi:hypothetical protein
LISSTYINHNLAVELLARSCSAIPSRLHLMHAFGRAASFLLGIIVVLGAAPLRAQDLDTGKSAERLFASNCAACHRSPRGLAKQNRLSLFFFLRQHYTSSQQSASELATYLVATSGDGRRAKQKSTADKRQQSTASWWETLTGSSKQPAKPKRGKVVPRRSDGPPRPSANVPVR